MPQKYGFPASPRLDGGMRTSTSQHGTDAGTADPRLVSFGFESFESECDQLDRGVKRREVVRKRRKKLASAKLTTTA